MGKPTENVYRPCPCGSGQKYKFCCLERDRERRREILKDVPRVVGPDGEPIYLFDFEEAEDAHRRGQEFLHQGRGREAIPFFEKIRRATPMAAQPYNNLALAHFIEGELDKAIEYSERVDRVIDPGNVFALGNIVHFYLLVGRKGEAEALARRLRNLPGRDEYAVYKKCEALARLRWHEDVFQAAARGLAGADECRSDLHFFAGVAAANLARYEEAVRHLEEAVPDSNQEERARRYLRLLKRREGPGTLEGDWPYLEVQQWIPWELFERCRSEEEARRLPGLVEALVGMLNDRPDADDLPVRMLRIIGTPEAVEVLRKVAFGTFGTDPLRFSALQALYELHVIPMGQTVRIWHEGAWRDVQTFLTEVTDVLPSPVPEHLRDEMGDLLEALRRRDGRRAEELGRKLLTEAPECPQVLQNLAQALRLEGKDEEAERLLSKALEIDPTYLFARASLARMRLDQGRIEEAKEILVGVKLPARIHPAGYASFILVQAELRLLEKDYIAAAHAWDIAQRLAPDSPAVKDAGDEWGFRLGGFLARMAERARRGREKARRRLLGRDPLLGECLEGQTRERLYSTAKAIGFASASPLRRGAFLKFILETLSDPAKTRALAESLPEEPRRALSEVLDAGGVMAYAEFTRRHGGDDEDVEPQGSEPPRSILGRLKLMGFLFEGTVGGQESVVVPREIRAALRAEPGNDGGSVIPSGRGDRPADDASPEAPAGASSASAETEVERGKSCPTPKP